MSSIKQQVNNAITALGRETDKAKNVDHKFKALVAKDQDNREIRKRRTFMTPDQFHGSDIDQIKQKAASLVSANRKEGGQPLRTTIISTDWKEETVWEWVDTSKTAKRWRTTQRVTAQVAAKTGDGVRLVTVAIAKDKQSNGQWGSLYGNLHQYSDPMLEENVHKAGP